MPTITDRIIRLTPSTYVHVCDNNTNITRVIVGPVTFTRMDHEEIVLGPEQLVTVPKGSYAVVTNPAVRGDDGQVVRDASGQPKLKHGDREVRFAQEPFPLYPGESLVGKVAPLEVVNPNEALHLRATRDFAQPVDDGAAIERRAGDECHVGRPRRRLVDGGHLNAEWRLRVVDPAAITCRVDEVGLVDVVAVHIDTASTALLLGDQRVAVHDRTGVAPREVACLQVRASCDEDTERSRGSARRWQRRTPNLHLNLRSAAQTQRLARQQLERHGVVGEAMHNGRWPKPSPHHVGHSCTQPRAHVLPE